MPNYFYNPSKHKRTTVGTGKHANEHAALTFEIGHGSFVCLDMANICAKFIIKSLHA